MEVFTLSLMSCLKANTVYYRGIIYNLNFAHLYFNVITESAAILADRQCFYVRVVRVANGNRLQWKYGAFTSVSSVIAPCFPFKIGGSCQLLRTV